MKLKFFPPFKDEGEVVAADTMILEGKSYLMKDQIEAP
jgi:hypothetical protein